MYLTSLSTKSRPFLCLITFVVVAGLGFSCNTPTEKEPVNFLFYIADDMSPFAESQKIPGFRRIAEQGVTFSQAYTNAPSCTPARGVLLTGLPMWKLREGSTLFGALPADLPVFPLLLEEAGYFVGHTGKAWGPGSLAAGGWADDVNPVGRAYQDIKIEPQPAGMSNVDYAANFEAFISEKPADQPFFFWYGSFEPHRRFEAGQGLASGKTLDDAYVPASMPNHEVIQNDILDYDIEVEHADNHFSRILAKLEAIGELENTVIIVTSDHGMPFPRAKATGLYDDATRIPLMFSGPGISGNSRVVSDFVGLMDLAPTILDLAGLPQPEGMVGQSIKPQLNAEANGRLDQTRDHMILALERHTIARPDYKGYPMRAIRTDDHLLVHNYEPTRWPAGDPDYISIHQGIFGDIDAGPAKDFIIDIANNPELAEFHTWATAQRPEYELFDLSSDPAQLVNVAGDSKYLTVRDSLNTLLDGYLKSNGDPRAFGKSPWDENIYYFGDLPDTMPAPDPNRWDLD